MLSLRNLLSTAGLVSGKELITLYGAELDFEELTSMIQNKEVSVHTEPMGGKNYRYPYYEPRIKEDGAEKLFEAIRNRPWMNAKTIRETLEISQASFERWEAELLQEGRITRTKKGVAWLYTVNDTKVEKPEKHEKVPKGAWYIWSEYSQPRSGGKSLQQLAKDSGCSREVITEGYKWMVDQGILVGEELVGFKAMSVAERKAWLNKTFPKFDNKEPWEEDHLDYCCSDERMLGSTAASLTQPTDELEQLILETMEDQPSWTLKSLMAKIPPKFRYGQENNGIINPVAKKLIQLSKDGVINRDWDGSDETPAIYSLKNRV